MILVISGKGIDRDEEMNIDRQEEGLIGLWRRSASKIDMVRIAARHPIFAIVGVMEHKILIPERAARGVPAVVVGRRQRVAD